MKKFLLMVLLSVAAMSVLTACETMEGVGQDTKKAGQNIEDAADRNK